MSPRLRRLSGEESVAVFADAPYRRDVAAPAGLAAMG